MKGVVNLRRVGMYVSLDVVKKILTDPGRRSDLESIAPDQWFSNLNINRNPPLESLLESQS